MSIKLQVKLPEKTLEKKVEYPGTIRLGELLSRYDIEPSSSRYLLVNGRKKGIDYQVRDGDRVLVFPVISGG